MAIAQGAVAPTIIVGKALTRAIRDADSLSLARAVVLNQFLGAGNFAGSPYSTIYLASGETPPYLSPSPYKNIFPAIVGYNKGVSDEPKLPPGAASNLEMRVNIESTDPLWTISLEVKNPHAFAIPLNFATGQQFDFLLENQDSKQRIWQWSAGKSFSPAEKKSFWLEPGEIKKYSAGFDPKRSIRTETNSLSLKGFLHIFPQPLFAEAQVIYVDR